MFCLQIHLTLTYIKQQLITELSELYFKIKFITLQSKATCAHLWSVRIITNNCKHRYKQERLWQRKHF